MNLKEQISRIKEVMGVINENIPQPGKSSGSPLSDEERQGMESRTEELTVNEWCYKMCKTMIIVGV